MKKLILLLIVATPFVVVFSCRNEPVLPEQQVSFANDILPIIQSSCQHSGCHDTVPGETVSMIDYTSVMDLGEVKPGAPLDSKLYEVITAQDDDRMPQEPYLPLSDRSMKLIYIWIAQGAKDN